MTSPHQIQRSHLDEADEAVAESVPTLSTVDEGTAIAGPNDSPYNQQQYSLDDVLESTREGQDESAVIESLESTKSVSKSSMLPSMSDDFLMNTLQDGNYGDGKEEEEDDPNINRQSSQGKSHRTSAHSNNDDLSEITRKLEASPWMRGQENSGTANITQKDPSQISSFDLFCNNASKLLPSQKTTFKQPPEDPASARADPNNDGGDIENPASSSQMDEKGESPNGNQHSKSNSQALQGLRNFGQKTKADVHFFVEFLEPYRSTLWRNFLKVIFYALLPSLAIASILYYGTGNPPTGTAWVLCTNETSSRGIRPIYASASKEGSNSTNPDEEWCIDENKSLAESSVSWWFLFLGRQVVTFCLATFMQLIIIDFFTFRTKLIRNIVGTHASLTIAASKGWPFILFMWAILNFILLYGSRNFARHWLYWQKYVGLFNAGNPSGNVTDKQVYKIILYVSAGLSVAVAIKRALMGNFVGKRVVSNYRNQLSTVIKRNMLMSEVAAFSATLDSRDHRKTILRRYDEMQAMYVKPLERNKDTSETNVPLEDLAHNSAISESTYNVNSTRKSTADSSFQNGIAEMLDEWDDPVLEAGKQDAPKMTDVLYFRRAINFIDGRYPFSPSFGKAGTRVECIESAQKVFDRLKTNRRDTIDFQKLKQLANEDDLINQGKLQELIKVFRPNKHGEISRLDFVKSCDSVYKSLKLFLANVNNSSQIDRAYEKIINIAFYAIALFVILAVFGVDINALFILLSSILISFAFMIQSASSKYLEGILLVLVRKPYDVGDRIVILDPNAAVDNFGPPSGGWVVEKVDLYTTTVRLGTTREYCTFSNGSLANSRILNMNRTDKPNIFHYVKVTLDVTQEQLDTFRQEVTQFVKDRPRSWIKIVNMRCDSIETEMQYLQYVIIIQHREKWQSFLAIQIDQGEVFVFCQKLMRKLGMNYTAPKMPIELVGGRTQKALHSVVASKASLRVDDMDARTSSLDIDDSAPYNDKNKNI